MSAPAPLKRAILLYAVASNNLYGNCLDDLREIEQGAEGIDLGEYAVFAYVVSPGAKSASLLELRKSSGGVCAFDTLREYDRKTFSTDPFRLRQVIDDMTGLCPAEKYGLILWSHGTGWSHEDVKHPEQVIVNRAFGMDKYGGLTDYMNIDELADAIPAGKFDFIWFDACYMSGIETIYQLRDKCDYFVGYPTEVWSPGMPYNRTIPLLLKSDPNLVGAADLFADYYLEQNESFTIAVLRTSGLEELAVAARSLYADATAPAAGSLLKYSRKPCGPFYDFRQFTLGFTSTNAESQDRFEKANRFMELLSDLTLYKKSSSFNFSYPGYGPLRSEYLIPEENFGGINCHWFSSSEADFDTYYRTLDWYRDAIAPANPQLP